MNAYEITRKYDAEGVKYLGCSNYFLYGMLGSINYALAVLTGVKANATDKEHEIICEELGLIEEWRETVYKYALQHGNAIDTMSATELCAALSK